MKRCRAWSTFGQSKKRIVCGRSSSHGSQHAKKIGKKLYVWQDGVGGIMPLELEAEK